MSIPTRSNPNTRETVNRPYTVFYTPSGKEGKITRSEREGEETVLYGTVILGTLCVSYFKYGFDEKTKARYKSTEYFQKTDTVKVWKTKDGEKRGVNVRTAKAAEIAEEGIDGVKMSTGAYLYVLEMETGNIARIELTAGQLSEWFDFKNTAGEYPYFYMTMRETTKADKKAKAEKYNRSVNMPDYTIVFHAVEGGQDDTATDAAANEIGIFFGNTATIEQEYYESETAEHSEVNDDDIAF